MTPKPKEERVSEDRIRNLRAWADARVGALSGADITVALCDEVLALRRHLREAREALRYLAEVPFEYYASGHDTIGYMRGNRLLYVDHLRPLRHLASLAADVASLACEGEGDISCGRGEARRGYE